MSIAGARRFPAASASIDVVGLFCPVPVTRTARRMEELGPGEILEVQADDRMVLLDLPCWCFSWRHEYLGHLEKDGVLHLFIRKGDS